MSRKRKKRLWLILLVALAGLTGFGVWQKKRVKPILVQIETVKREPIIQTVNASGSLIPETQVKISANVSARITHIAVREGQYVRRDQLLVELDKAQYEAAFEQAQSAVQSSQANLRKVDNELRRLRTLYSRQLTSEAELEAAIAQKEVAESQVVQAHAALKRAQDDLSKTRITAPIKGRVTNVRKEVGEIALGSVFQEDVILVISDMARMKVRVEVDETDVINIQIGDTARIELDAIPQTTFRGTVAKIAHSATTRGLGTQEQVTNFQVEIAVTGQDERFRPGMSATVDIVTDVRLDAVVVPIQALTMRKPVKSKESADSTGLPATASRRKEETVEVVFVIERPGAETSQNRKRKPEKELLKVRQQPVTIGISSDTHFEITAGLTEGQEIVIGSYKAVSRELQNDATVRQENRKKEDTGEKS